MQTKRENRNTWVFLSFLLLAGSVNMISRTLPHTLDALMNCVLQVIYTGLLIFWIETVYVRLLPSRTRSYMLAAAGFMLLYMLLRFFKYDFAVTASAQRYAVYAYWIPQMMIPTLFLMICVRIRRSAGRGGKWNEALLLIPAALLAFMAMSNDLHSLVYVRSIPLPEFIVDSGTYRYSIGMYLMYAWLILAVAAGLALLFSQTGRLPKKTALLLALDITLWLGTVFFDVLYLYPHSTFRFFNTPEAQTFGILGVFEICIRAGLIPNNENYSGFFPEIRMPVVVTDRKFVPVYASAGTVSAGKDEMKKALQEPVYPGENLKLSGKEIRAGYAFWVEDETQIRKVQERLMEVNETIEQENTLIEAETRQKEENAYITARHRIYHEIAGEMYPVQKRIGELLGDAVPGTEDYREKIAQISVLNAYVKRKTNLLLLAGEKESLSSYELYLALEESAGYLAYRGLQVSVEEPVQRDCPVNDLVGLYDTFEQIAEKLIGSTASMMVSWRKDGLRLAAHTGAKPDTGKMALPVNVYESEGILYMDILTGKDGERA